LEYAVEGRSFFRDSNSRFPSLKCHMSREGIVVVRVRGGFVEVGGLFSKEICEEESRVCTDIANSSYNPCYNIAILCFPE